MFWLQAKFFSTRIYQVIVVDVKLCVMFKQWRIQANIGPTSKENQVHKIRCMALIAEGCKNILMKLNDRCEDYRMKINVSKTKVVVTKRKPKKIDMRNKDAVEKVDKFKYLGCNISSNMNCCQEVKQRIATAKEAFNRKGSIFCGPLEKELMKRLVKYFVWSVDLYGAENWTL